VSGMPLLPVAQEQASGEARQGAMRSMARPEQGGARGRARRDGAGDSGGACKIWLPFPFPGDDGELGMARAGRRGRGSPLSGCCATSLACCRRPPASPSPLLAAAAVRGHSGRSVNTKKWYRRKVDLWAKLGDEYHSAGKNLLKGICRGQP
jgi:hypothetical protein